MSDQKVSAIFTLQASRRQFFAVFSILSFVFCSQFVAILRFPFTLYYSIYLTLISSERLTDSNCEFLCCFYQIIIRFFQDGVQITHVQHIANAVHEQQLPAILLNESNTPSQNFIFKGLLIKKYQKNQYFVWCKMM